MIPLVSILIPAYNSEKWIKATIESALVQTWRKKEIIIVDDGSLDSTFQIAKKFESESVKVISQENSGACVARNKALSIAQGDFIQWLDSDDILAPDKITIQLNNADRSPETKVLHSSAFGLFYFRIKKARFAKNPLWQDQSPLNWLLLHLGEGYYMASQTWLVSRSLTELAGPWDERLMLNQDGEYFCRVVSSSDSICFHPEALSYYREVNLSSISRTRKGKHFESLIFSKNLCVDHLLRLENSDATKKACINYLQRGIFSPSGKNLPIIENIRKRIFSLGGSITPHRPTKKFAIFKTIFGMKTAALIKEKLWHTEIRVRKYWDKFLAFLLKDGI